MEFRGLPVKSLAAYIHSGAYIEQALSEAVLPSLLGTFHH